jgi:predicted RNA methylase
MSQDAFSCIDQVGQCMADEARSEAFQKAIRAAVEPGMRVLDVGTGSGLLAMFAAQAGASKVVALEFDPFVAAVAKQNIARNGFDDKIEVVVGDATKFNFSGCAPFDAVLIELLTTGMIDEVQVDAVRNLHARGVVTPATRFIPERILTYASIVDMDFRVCGLEMMMVRHLWLDFPDRERAKNLSSAVEVSDVRFSRSPDPWLDKVLEFPIEADGVLNGIKLWSDTELFGGQYISDTLTLNAPVIVPMRERKVGRGDRLLVRLSYVYGQGFDGLRVEPLEVTPSVIHEAA